MTVTVDCGPGWIRLQHRPATDRRAALVRITTGGIATLVNNADDLITHGESYAQACRDLAPLLAPKARPRDEAPTLFDGEAR